MREMRFPEHLITLLHDLCEGREAVVRTQTGSVQIGKGVRQGCILSPYLFNLYAQRVMREAGLGEETEEGAKIGGRNINNLRYADDVTLVADSEEGSRPLLLKVSQASTRPGLHLNIEKN